MDNKRVECGKGSTFHEGVTCKRSRGHLGLHANVRTVKRYALGQILWGDNESTPAKSDTL